MKRYLSKASTLLATPICRAVGRIIVSGTALAVMLALVPQQSKAIFGFGDIVFDPSAWAELVSGNLSWTQTLTQAIKLATDADKTYSMAVSMIGAIDHATKSDWVTLAQMAVTDHVSDLNQAGESANWSSVTNGSSPAVAKTAWADASLGLKDLSSILAGEKLGSSQVLAQLASSNALTGSGIKCLQTVGVYRGNSLANALGPVVKLAMANIDGVGDNNTTMKQANVTNGNLQAMFNQEHANGELAACMVEQMIVQNKINADNQARSLNNLADFRADVTANSNTPLNTSSAFTHAIP